MLSEIQRTDLDVPAWATGPYVRDDALTFRKPGEWRDPKNKSWACGAIFNPTLIEKDGALYLFYRASPVMESIDSRIGAAVYRDGKWTDFENNPVVFGDAENETLGCEDPKIYRAEGKYYLFYNGVYPHAPEQPGAALYSGLDVDINLAVSDDLVHWEKRGRVVPLAISKSWAKGAVIPRNEKGEAVKFGDKYYMFLSEGCGGRQCVGTSADMEHWQFEYIEYCDLSKYGHIEEIACCVAESGRDDFILDVFYSVRDGERKRARGMQVLYKRSDPFRPIDFFPAATFAWGGLLRYRGERIFAQGWECPRGTPMMYFYTEKKGGR